MERTFAVRPADRAINEALRAPRFSPAAAPKAESPMVIPEYRHVNILLISKDGNKDALRVIADEFKESEELTYVAENAKSTPNAITVKSVIEEDKADAVIFILQEILAKANMKLINEKEGIYDVSCPFDTLEQSNDSDDLKVLVEVKKIA